jgi:fructosamine-3-kinase
MLSRDVQQHVAAAIQQNAGIVFSTLHFSPLGGGSINHAYAVTADSGEKFFCKINSQSRFPGLFEAEKQGLELLGAQKLIRVPQVIAATVTGDTQVLVLQWIEQGMRTDAFWKRFGQQLAARHSVQEKRYGLPADNYMGALVQHNRQSESWNEFFIGQRLEPQVRLAADKGLLAAKEIRQFEKLYAKLPGIFPDAQPCLLHGDLWSGNFLCDEQGRPVLIDPAVYYGNAAIDLAMTTLFGGFDAAFYESYHHIRPFAPNYREQWEVCNLYPLLVHVNLFGESYRAAVLQTIRHY